MARPGDTIYLRGGVYRLTEGVSLTRDGASGRPISIVAYPGERPVLDGGGMTATGYWQGWVVDFATANWNHVRGIEVRNGPMGGVVLRAQSHDNVIEALDVHHNGRLSEWEGKGISVFEAAANNLLLNNDSHHNRDLRGDNADGFSVSTTGRGNVLRGNRAWRNSDDGFDFFNTYDNSRGATYVIEANWSFENGYGANFERLGDGNGFKLGGRRPGTSSTSGGHFVAQNLSWGNARSGFDENNATRPLTLYNNTAFDNGEFNFGFWDLPNTFRNNVAFGEGEVAAAGSTAVNSWTLPVSLTRSDFLSLSDRGADGPRAADGSLPLLPFLRLASRSDLVDSGVDVGIAYAGAAPDLGGYESAITGVAATDLGVDGPVAIALDAAR